jgi:hypothetical protein
LPDRGLVPRQRRGPPYAVHATPGEGIVSFDAARLVVNPVLLIAPLAELLLDLPWQNPHGRVFDGDGVLKRGWPGARPTLDQVQVL